VDAPELDADRLDPLEPVVERAGLGRRLELAAPVGELGGAERGGVRLERVGRASDGLGVAGLEAVAPERTRRAHPRGDAQPAPAALVLESPFTSARDMAARMLVPPIPWLWSRISRVHYDTRSLVGRLDCPVFVAHGSRDINIPVRMGRQVYLAARRQGALLIVDGAGHNDVSDVGGERYWSWMVAAVGVPASALPRASAAR